MVHLIRKDSYLLDFGQGHREAERRHMGHLDFHTSRHPCVIDSDRRRVTASRLGRNTQVDNDSSIISVAGTDQRPRCMAIIF